MFEIKTHSRMSIFEQLKMQLLEYITAGILHENEQLPSSAHAGLSARYQPEYGRKSV